MSKVKGKWVMSTQYREGKRFYINLEFVKESCLKSYERRQNRKFRKLNYGEMRYEYFDDFAEVSIALYDMVYNFTIGHKE